MTRTTASIVLFLLLVTTAGAVLPGLGGVPHIAEENTARADIGEVDTNNVFTTFAFPPGVVARNTIEGDPIPVCGVLRKELKEDVQAAIADLNAELKELPPGVTTPPGIMEHNAFAWSDRCPVDDIDITTKIGFVEVGIVHHPCGNTSSYAACFHDEEPEPPGPLFTIQKSPRIELKWAYFHKDSGDLYSSDKRRWVIAHELAHAIGYANRYGDGCVKLQTEPTLMFCVPGTDAGLATPYLQTWDRKHHMRLFEPNEVVSVTRHIATRINPTTVRFQIDASAVKVEDEIMIRRKIAGVWSSALHTWDYKATTTPVSLLNQPASAEYGIFRTTKATLPGQEVGLGFLQAATVGEPQPEVSISISSSSVMEGEDAEFIIKRKRTSATDLHVTLYEDHDGRFFETTNTPGNRTVTIDAGSLSTKHTVVTVNDPDDELNGSVTITIQESPHRQVRSRVAVRGGGGDPRQRRPDHHPARPLPGRMRRLRALHEQRLRDDVRRLRGVL